MKKKFVIILMIIIINIIAISSIIITSFLVDQANKESDLKVGEISIVAKLYYVNQSGNLQEVPFVHMGNGSYKQGIYEVNLTSNSAPNYLDKVRLYVDVYSKSDTYFRIKIVEQLTLLLTDSSSGMPTEYSIVMDEPTDFYYTFNDANNADPEHENWYDNRSKDGYIYYKNPVKKPTSGTYTRLGLIKSYYPGQSYISQPLGFSLQIGLKIEAVQAIGGPEKNWGIAPPWGGVWSEEWEEEQ